MITSVMTSQDIPSTNTDSINTDIDTPTPSTDTSVEAPLTSSEPSPEPLTVVPPSPGPDILSLGELLVEIMRDKVDSPLSQIGTFLGPYASGAPAIFTHAAAQLGGHVGFIGVCGNDAFGFQCVNKLQQAGVDISHIRTANDRTTGTAFVGYKGDGSRQFVYHMKHSAAALLDVNDVAEDWLTHCRWLHITGSSLALSDTAREACYFAAKRAKEVGASISFDPNLRPELLSAGEIQALCEPILNLADVVLPSGHEAALLLGLDVNEQDDDGESAARGLLRRGIETVILKLGDRGCKIYSGSNVNTIDAISVQEVDPTGAGDCFAAGYAVAQLSGWGVIDSARFANVAGALAVTTQGLMEANLSRAEVESYL
ncbi:MAG: sugar kinase [Deinococcota bacterium]